MYFLFYFQDLSCLSKRIVLRSWRDLSAWVCPILRSNKKWSGKRSLSKGSTPELWRILGCVNWRWIKILSRKKIQRKYILKRPHSYKSFGPGFFWPDKIKDDGTKFIKEWPKNKFRLVFLDSFEWFTRFISERHLWSEFVCNWTSWKLIGK